MAIVVNGERIEEAEIEQVRRQLELQQGNQPGAGADNTDTDPLAFAKEAAIARVLVKQEALRVDPEVSPKAIEAELKKIVEQCGGDEALDKQLESVGGSREDITRDITLRLKVDALLDDVCKDLVPPSEEDARAHYEAHRAWFMVPERIRAAHIVKHVGGTVLDMHQPREEMQAMRSMIAHGTPFEELAARNSDCPDNAGDLGWFARGAMVPEFEDVVFALEKGEVSEVFETPFGLHIAKVYDRAPAQPRKFEEVKEQVTGSLFQERENALIDAFTDALRAKADIEEV